MAVVVRINDRGIQSLTAPGGDVWRMVRRMGRNTSVLAKAEAPPRGTGRLEAGIQDPEMTTVPFEAQARVRSTARHSLWVHEGTQGPIRRPGRGPMPIHNRSRTAVLAFSRRVRGQRANPFLARALREAFTIEMARR